MTYLEAQSMWGRVSDVDADELADMTAGGSLGAEVIRWP